MGKTIAQALIEEGMERGIERGMEKGMEKGVQKGVLSGQQEFLLRVLRERLGRAPKAVERKIRKIESRRRLEKLLAQALDAEAISDLDI